MQIQGKKILIIGGVAGGASAAVRARRLSEDASITILERGPHVSFANCGLPYALGGVIKDRKDLLLQTPDSLKARFNLDVRINTEAVSINRSNQSVIARSLETNEIQSFYYDKLILSMGAEAIRPPIPGLGIPGVFTLQTIPDLEKIQNWIAEMNSKSAVIIGGGFIGIETAENLVKRGIKVTLIERGNQVFPPADRDIAEFIHQEMKKQGVHLLLESELKELAQFGQNRIKLSIIQSSMKNSLETDIVILAIGVKPRSQLAKEAGLAIGKLGGVQVDAFMRTTDPNIYAVGDVIEAVQPQFGNAAYIPLAGPANRQGRIAAAHVFGKTHPYKGTLGTSVCQMFDLTVATTGLSTKALQRQAKAFESITVHPNDHAGYFPGANSMTLKLIFDPVSGKILGSQIIGKTGVDKRIDVLSVAIQKNMTVDELEDLELAYAPPYGSAKDPVNMAGFVASNVIRKDTKIIHSHDLENLDKMQVQFIDVRSNEEYENGHISGALNIPIDQLREHIHELDKTIPIVVYCQVGFRGYLAYQILSQNGFNVTNLNGGYKSWQARPAKI